MNTLRPGQIVVGRYTGIVTLAKTIGYGLWSEQPDGTIVGGAMYLDRDFDRDDSRRRLLRIHELGHALGYQHVQSRTSIMNPAIGPSPPTSIERAPSSRSSVRSGTRVRTSIRHDRVVCVDRGRAVVGASTQPCAMPVR